MKQIIMVSIIIFFSLTAISQTRDDARFLEKSVSYTLNPDGSWQKEYFHRVRLESYLATNRLLGETFILFNPEYQELTILKSETTMKDGKTVNTPDNAFNPVLPRSAHGFPCFSHLREMVITHTGLERGAVATLHYLLKTRSGFMPYFSAREAISDDLPVDRLMVKISVPPDKKLNITGFPAPLTPEIKKQPDRIIHLITFKDLKPFIHQPFDGIRTRQHLVFSTAENWKSAFPVWKDPAPIPESILKKAQDIRKRTDNPYEYCYRLQELINDEIDHCSIGTALSGFNLRSPEEIVSSNYGTGLEKARLFQQLLRELNIPADLVAIAIPGRVFQNVPSPFQFSGFLLKINSPSPYPVFLNPVEKTRHLFPYTLEGREYHNLNREETGRFSANLTHGIHISGILEIDKNRTRGSLQISLEGRFSPYFSCLGDCQPALSGTLKGILPVSKLEITGISLLTPAKVVVSAKVEGDFLKELYQNRFFMKKCVLPGIEDSLIQPKIRGHSLYLEGPLRFDVRLTLKPAPGLKTIFTAPPDSLENDTGRYCHGVEPLNSGDLYFHMHLELNKPIIEPVQYPEFRKLLSRYFIKEPLAVFKKGIEQPTS